MKTEGFKFLPWIILIISFLLPAYFYASLPDQVLIARGLFGGEGVFADKSLFTVFRVPMIELVCAAAVLVLGRAVVSPGRAAAFRSVCTILLFTVALKSLFQSFETVSRAEWASAFLYLTLCVVAVGIVAAIFAARSLARPFKEGRFQLRRPEKAGLAVLLVFYLGLAIAPIIYLSGK